MATRNQHQSALKKNIVPSVEGIVRHSKQTSLFLSVLCVQELQQQKIIYQLNLRENKTDVLDGARGGGGSTVVVTVTLFPYLDKSK